MDENNNYQQDPDPITTNQNQNYNPNPNPSGSNDKDKIAAGLLAIFLGGLGIHKFDLGYQREGIIMLVCGTVGGLLCGIGTFVAGVIGLIEGIMYLTKTDEQFKNTYVYNQRTWF